MQAGGLIMALGVATEASALDPSLKASLRPRTFAFGLRGLPQTGLDRSINYRWEAQNRIGRRPAMQFLGTGEETVSIKGVIYPRVIGSLDQLEQMRDEASLGVPRNAITGNGRYYGMWCIKAIKDVQAPYWVDGTPRKVEFTIEMTAYGPDGTFGGFGIFG